ncbi:MAG: hypothetical protein OSB12_09085 [Planctomycetota bacterium]|jgi:hypothetical protein|nr:hypothetical protein [Planctomycetota bacterium]
MEVREEEIHEALDEVVAAFRGGAIEIRSLVWRGRSFAIQQMHASWIDRSIQPPVHGFTVTLETDDLLELAYQEGDLVWRVERLFLQ